MKGENEDLKRKKKRRREDKRVNESMDLRPIASGLMERIN